MRFKKLRIFVGIAMIVFILFVGNAILFGKLINYDKKVENSTLNESGVLVLSNNPKESETVNMIRVEPNKTTQETAPTTTEAPVTETPVVVHKTTTRAS